MCRRNRCIPVYQINLGGGCCGYPAWNSCGLGLGLGGCGWGYGLGGCGLGYNGLYGGLGGFYF